MFPPGISYLQRSFNIHITGSHSWSQISLIFLKKIINKPKSFVCRLPTEQRSFHPH